MHNHSLEGKFGQFEGCADCSDRACRNRAEADRTEQEAITLWGPLPDEVLEIAAAGKMKNSNIEKTDPKGPISQRLERNDGS